jgi:ribosomal protein L40E
MLVAISVLISAALLVYVVAPLLATEAGGQETVPVDVTPLIDLKRRRLVVYENMQDLDFEYKSGKIAQNDYQSLRENYTREAAQLMAATKELELTKEDDALIEREVATRRSRRKLQPAEEYVCLKCGFENPLPVKFCGECGAPVSPRARRG